MRLVCASDLEEGDLLALGGDRYADPKRTHPEFHDKSPIVQFIVRESLNSVRISTDMGDFGFPPGHRVGVVGKSKAD